MRGLNALYFYVVWKPLFLLFCFVLNFDKSNPKSPRNVLKQNNTHKIKIKAHTCTIRSIYHMFSIITHIEFASCWGVSFSTYTNANPIRGPEEPNHRSRAEA